jgi:uncharacterized protein
VIQFAIKSKQDQVRYNRARLQLNGEPLSPPLAKKGVFSMIVIPKHVQEFLPGKMGWVATATKDGVPNTTPKGSIRVLDDQHIVFADLFSFKTRQNLEQNPRVAVTVVDMASHMGYQIKGTAELISSGPLYDQMAEELKQKSVGLPSLKYLVKITVEAVYDQSVGPNAGKQIA